MSRPLAAALLLTALLAGCMETPATAPSAETSPSILIDADRPLPTAGDVVLGPVAAPDLNATLDAPPKLVPGEWWKIKFTDNFADFDQEFIRVVAKVEPEGYVMGMPHEGWFKEAVVFHTPAFGDVNLDLSHHAHDVPFIPLKFPLTDGATWQTYWESEDPPLTATVSVESPTRARVTITGPNCPLYIILGVCPPDPPQGTVVELVYDAQVHEVVEFKQGNVFSYEVVEHGYDFEGWVTVPRAEDLVFLDGRIGASTVNLIPAGPAMPSDVVGVQGGFNRLSFILGAGNLLPHDGGAYRITATAPDGTAYVKESVPGGPFTISFLEHADPDGDWSLDYLVAGPGYAFIEGIAYHQYDVRLPDGLIRSDHSHEVVR